MLLFINSLGRAQTKTCILTSRTKDKSISRIIGEFKDFPERIIGRFKSIIDLRNHMCASLWPVHAWFKYATCKQEELVTCNMDVEWSKGHMQPTTRGLAYVIQGNIKRRYTIIILWYLALNSVNKTSD